MNPVRVIFQHDDQAKKWDVRVENVTSAREAKQAFTAVILTTHEIIPAILEYSLVRAVDGENSYQIIPAVL